MRRIVPAILSVLYLFLAFSLPEASGQIINRVVPTPHYFEVSMADFNAGDFQSALQGFNYDLRNAVKIPDKNGQMLLWLDSMTYWIMCGECHFQMARYDEALTAMNTAAQIYLNQPDWLKYVNYTSTPVAIARPQLPWGATTRKGTVGDFSQCKFQMLQESINLIDLRQRGTALAKQQQLTSIHANEIVTRLALMIRRRAEILGPLSQYDPLTKELTEILGARPCPPNHFSGVWVDTLYGLCLAAMGDDVAAVAQLEKSLLMQNLFDHQLTPYGLNTLGELALRAGKPKDAIAYYFEASLCATYFGDWTLLGETFRNMANCQKLLDKTKTLPALPLALQYVQSLSNPSPLVAVPLCHEVAEDCITVGNIKEAATLCNQAAALMNRKAIFETTHGARNHYLKAILSYLGAIADASAKKPLNLKVGDDHLVTALGFMRRGSLWLYHLSVLENLFQTGSITTRGPITVRIAGELYEYLLRDPSSVDWALQPMDSLAQMTFAPPSAYQRWLFVALQRGDREKAFEISERARRARFYSIFNLGPRLFSLRMLFEGDTEEVSQQMLLDRQTLTLDFAKFGELSNQVKKVKQQLQMLPTVPRDQAEAEKQKELFAQLENLSLIQEAMLRPIALTRTSVPNVFPPIMTVEQIRNELPEKTAILVFTETLGNYYGFLIDRRSLSMWPILQSPGAPTLQRMVSDFLEALGNRDINRPIGFKDLIDTKPKWKKAGADLFTRLLGEEREVSFTELVIVPTGPLWYAPFEAMCMTGKDGNQRPLLFSGDTPLTIRYAPMASLGVPRKSSRSMVNETLVLTGKFYSRDKPEVAKEAVDRYTKKGVKNLVTMSTIPKEDDYREFPSSASAFATRVRQMVVLDDVPSSRTASPVDWSPFTGDRARLNNPIPSWLILPLGGPQLMVLPGFHTPAESSLKTQGASKANPNGDDLFLSALVLQACGARTILMSRWRVGGRTSYDLVGEFLKNYNSNTAVQAWRQAVVDVSTEPLVLGEEPRVKSSATDEAPLANHPFFWSGFMLLDRGEKPARPGMEQKEKTKLD